MEIVRLFGHSLMCALVGFAIGIGTAPGGRPGLVSVARRRVPVALDLLSLRVEPHRLRAARRNHRTPGADDGDAGVDGPVAMAQRYCRSGIKRSLRGSRRRIRSLWVVAGLYGTSQASGPFSRSPAQKDHEPRADRANRRLGKCDPKRAHRLASSEGPLPSVPSPNGSRECPGPTHPPCRLG